MKAERRAALERHIDALAPGRRLRFDWVWPGIGRRWSVEILRIGAQAPRWYVTVAGRYVHGGEDRFDAGFSSVAAVIDGIAAEIQVLSARSHGGLARAKTR